MKEILTNLAVFIVLCLTFSDLTGCRGSKVDTSNTTAENTTGAANSTASENKSTGYPPLAAGLADSEIELLDGTKKKISDYKGKVILLNLWGTWCGPCRAEMPNLVAMQKQYADQGMEILGLNIGGQEGGVEEIDDIKKFSDKMGLNYTLARFGTAGVRQFYRITSKEVVPQTMLIDRDGHLRGVFIGGGRDVIASMQKELDKAMAE